MEPDVKKFNKQIKENIKKLEEENYDFYNTTGMNPDNLVYPEVLLEAEREIQKYESYEQAKQFQVYRFGSN